MSHLRRLLVPGAASVAVLLAVPFAACKRSEPQPTPAPPTTQAPTPAPTATPEPPPSTEAAPPTTIAAVAPPGKTAATKGVRTGKTPPAPPKAVAEAEAALKAGNYDQALKLYERAATAAPADKKLAATARSLGRKFVPSLTESWNRGSVSDKLSGFETGGVAVKRVPENEGRLDFVVTPARVRPGDPFRIDIHLTNAGKKAIKLSGLTAVRNADGRKEGGAVALSDRKSVESRQRERIGTIEGTWPDAKAWTMDVQAAAGNGDAYEAKLRWQ